MAELKRNFLKGGMNKDLDERLVRNGQYRDAVNIEVNTSEGANSGSAQVVFGNSKWDSTILKGSPINEEYSNAKTVGVYSDNENNYIYNFIAGASDQKLERLFGGVYNYIGIKSDIIERLRPHETNGDLTDSTIVFNDVYEVMLQPGSAGSLTKIKGIGLKSYSIPGSSSVFKSASGIRVGMRVQAILPDGTDYWAGNEIYVKKIEEVNPTICDLTITKLSQTGNESFPQNFIDAGVVLKFSAPRILKFKKGTTQELEQNVTNGEVTFTPKSSNITAINVIDDYLLWTDGRNEPKKINIQRCIQGSEQPHSSIGTKFPKAGDINHTHLVVKDKEGNYISKGHIQESHITVLKPNPTQAPKVTPRLNGEIDLATNTPVLGKEIGPGTPGWGGYAPFALSFNNNNLYDENTQFKIKPLVDLQTPWIVGQIIRLTGQTTSTVVDVEVHEVQSNPVAFTVSLVVSGDYDNISEYFVDIGYSSDGTTSTSPDEIWTAALVPKESFYLDDFLRFAYRYRYADGEYSCISPYSTPAFMPSDYSYSPKDAFNIGMQNYIDSIDVSEYVHDETPSDVKDIELIFKSQKSENHYVFKTINLEHGPMNSDVLFNKIQADRFVDDHVVVDKRLFGHTIPSDQLLRNFDAVPKKAIAQEVQANRLMLANYTQDYNLIDSGNNKITNVEGVISRASQAGSYGSSFESANTLWAAMDSSLGIQLIDTPTSSSGRYFSLSLPLSIEYDPGNNFDGVSQYHYTVPQDGTYTVKAYAFVKGYKYTEPGSLYYEPRDTRLSIAEVDTDPSSAREYVPFSEVAFTNRNHPLEDFGDFYLNGFQYDYFWLNEEEVWGITIEEVQVQLEAGKKYGLFVSSTVEGHPEFEDLAVYNGKLEVTAAPYAVNTLPVQKGKLSVKSDRDYNLGVVYRDYLGRETSVLTHESMDINVPKNASAYQNKIRAKIISNPPRWAKTFKFFIKENISKYHNLVLESALLAGNTDYAYLAFNSADSSKLKTGDYINLKKKHGVSTPVVSTDASWRVIAKMGDIEGDDLAPVPADIISEISNTQGLFFAKVRYDAAFATYIANFEDAADNTLISPGSNNGAVFETKPINSVDNELYYEIESAKAIYLDAENVSLNIKVGSQVSTEANVASILTQPGVYVKSVQGATSRGTSQVSNGCSDAYCAVELCDFSGVTVVSDVNIEVSAETSDKYFNFLHEDGYVFRAPLGKSVSIGDNTIYLKAFDHAKFRHTLNWSNCVAFGNGVESDTIRDDFNNTELFAYLAGGKQSGFKSSITLSEYKEFTEKNKIIFSELYNSTTNSNGFNEFLMSKNIVKEISPDYGSIQKLFSRDDDLVTLCEKKCTRVLSKKDALFNADGQEQLLSTDKVLGQSIPFSGDYGISKNPESFVSDEYRAYFTDKARGAVLRLSRDGLTPISNEGLRDWFNDHMISSQALVGSFDGNKEEYNLTLHEVTSPTSKKNMYTLSFNETSNLWVSFKTFYQEAGLTLNNRYFTFKNGYLWRHHSSSADKSTFYGKHESSSITTLFNADPSLVKTFRTINYEGTQGKVIQNIDVEIKDNEYYNLEEKKGWYVDSVNTDLINAKSEYFKKKEGKWFANIKGEDINYINYADGGTAENNTLDTSEFNIQGLGQLNSDATLISGTMPSVGFDLVISVSSELESEAESDVSV